MYKRREFLKAGLAGVCLLAVTHGIDRGLFAQTTSPAGSLDLKTLANKDAVLIAALVPAVLADALPDEPAARAIAINEVVEAFDRTVTGLSPPVQKEVAQLLSLLTFAPTRRLVAGVGVPWQDATEVDVRGFIDSWRNSRIALLQQGYQALARLMIACWYGNPLSWQRVGYGGPPHAQQLGLL